MLLMVASNAHAVGTFEQLFNRFSRSEHDKHVFYDKDGRGYSCTDILMTTLVDRKRFHDNRTLNEFFKIAAQCAEQDPAVTEAGIIRDLDNASSFWELSEEKYAVFKRLFDANFPFSPNFLAKVARLMVRDMMVETRNYLATSYMRRKPTPDKQYDQLQLVYLQKSPLQNAYRHESRIDDCGELGNFLAPLCKLRNEVLERALVSVNTF
jgi:hypothetical protein